MNDSIDNLLHFGFFHDLTVFIAADYLGLYLRELKDDGDQSRQVDLCLDGELVTILEAVESYPNDVLVE